MALYPGLRYGEYILLTCHDAQYLLLHRGRERLFRAQGNFTSDGSGGGWIGATTASSNHPGGVNVGFGDGSVKFIKDSVNYQTWWGLGTRNMGEIVSSDAY